MIASADDEGTVKVSFKLFEINWTFSIHLVYVIIKLWDYRRKNAAIDLKESCDYISDLTVSKDKKILLATRYLTFLIAWKFK